MNEKMITPFIEDTKAMFIERASWCNGDVEWFKNVDIKEFYADQTNEDGVIYDCLEFEEDYAIIGHYTELESIFNEIRDTLWYSGIIQQVYNEHGCYELDACYNYMTETLFEMCPYCEEEVELKATMKLQVCPNCGKMIAPCALCCMDYVNCKMCPLGCNS